MRGVIFALFIFCAITANAQSIYLLGGINSSILYEQKDIKSEELSRNYSPGFQIGASADFNISKYFSVSPGLSFSLKTEETEYSEFMDNPDPFDDMLLETTSSIKEFYLDFPVHLKFRYSLSTVDLVCFAGPYVNLLVLDKTVSELYIDGAIVPDPVIVGEEKFINRLDYGASIGFGFEYQSWLIQLSEDKGLYRKMKYENFEDDKRYRNTVFRLSMAYKL